MTPSPALLGWQIPMVNSDGISTPPPPPVLPPPPETKPYPFPPSERPVSKNGVTVDRSPLIVRATPCRARRASAAVDTVSAAVDTVSTAGDVDILSSRLNLTQGQPTPEQKQKNTDKNQHERKKKKDGCCLISPSNTTVIDFVETHNYYLYVYDMIYKVVITNLDEHAAEKQRNKTNELSVKLNKKEAAQHRQTE